MFKVNNRKTLGDLGEEQAQKFLQKQGYKLLYKNYRCPLGEIDLIMSKAKTVLIVEVKSGSHSNISPKVHFDWHKKKKLIRLAQFFLMHYPKYCDYTLQFDLVVYQPHLPCSIEHYPYAIDDMDQL
ncbi:MAG TPA: YraN family protein [Oligoflexia bacterium]|nr:YraN family protein [Oligoflexia bacterium]HMR24441.1 YraN family protein [Oligoflexia bacterium]